MEEDHFLGKSRARAAGGVGGVYVCGVRLVVGIRELSAADVDTVGGKGANLGELARANFAVPEGFILTTEAYAIAARAAGLDAGQPATNRERLLGQAVPEEVGHAISSASSR